MKIGNISFNPVAVKTMGIKVFEQKYKTALNGQDAKDVFRQITKESSEENPEVK